MGKQSNPKGSSFPKVLSTKEPMLKIQPIMKPTMITEPALKSKSKGKAQSQAGIVTALKGSKTKMKMK